MKSYAERFFSENNLAGGTGSVFGSAYSPGGMGTYGNAIQTTDWYASNDARQPFPKGSTRLNKRSNPLNRPRKVKNVLAKRKRTK